ncbi:DUF5916 domain-containing protein [Imperialibacter roseus]|uniref:DUF5916 domain-containing protein n=1 Tax=Imperialibacter roseus TaxID=1324217 RepID=A0ABZ0IP70_9BACT|nr:DUF5916 domain-containing protein [Imperialibacter roseus]WOK06827.1 DUF5916 domain-containing protein [Imperialibacter roseus]
MKTNFTISIILGILMLFQNAKAQDIFSPSEKRLSIRATSINDKMAIDGVLEEEAWSRADSLSDFIQIEPNQGRASENKTTVKLLFDKEFLYIGVNCFDKLGRGGIRVPDLKRDFDWRAHDTFAVCIDGFSDNRNSMSFVTNPYGAQKDYLSFDAVLFDSDWNGLWKVRTSITEEGWFAEFQIPWKSIRYAKGSGETQSWGINFLRLRRASNEISAWSPYPRSFSFNRMEYSGELIEIQPPTPSTNIQVNPYSLVSANRQMANNKFSDFDARYKLGGDVKWAINSNAIVDLTVNTDFAQADADVQVNNVSRFSVLFPEKRQFFLENASLFGPGLMADGNTSGKMQILPFFSRRIGLAQEGRPMPVDGGVRLVNRSLKQNFGLMAVRQRSYDTLPSANFAVGRYSKNLGKQNRLGAIATMKSTTGSHTNLTGGFDGFLRLGNSNSLNFMALQSINDNGTGKGFGGYSQYYYTSNSITAWWTESIVTKDFTTEMGFLSRTDIIGTNPGAVANLRGKYIPFKRFIRSLQPGVSTGWYHQASSKILLERELKLTPFWLEMQHGGFFGFDWSSQHQNLITSFIPLGVSIDPGQYDFQRYSFTAGSDPSRKVSYSLKYEFGEYYDGKLKTSDAALSIIPIPHISLKASISRNQFESVGINSDSRDVILYTLQGRLALNPRIQLVGLYQKTSQNGLDSYNARFAWEYRPLSYIYLVLNSRETLGDDYVSQTEQQGIFKVSYLKQF